MVKKVKKKTPKSTGPYKKVYDGTASGRFLKASDD